MQQNNKWTNAKLKIGKEMSLKNERINWFYLQNCVDRYDSLSINYNAP